MRARARVCLCACVRACMRACVCVLPKRECSKSKDQNVQCLPHATPASLLSQMKLGNSDSLPYFCSCVCVADRARFAHKTDLLNHCMLSARCSQHNAHVCQTERLC